ncbi:MAG TPA: glycoside hydrolase family 3 N-terminal domain-containing protein, partial [Steroidobacteraceae bacterium]|nr:glycoside hydrolase family 3 N-terminal domain-containing protein [Steroidobacteraceae bacterium]
DAIKAGTIGNLLNLVGAGPVREMQELAVNHSRLRIPLLIGLDVIHGHRTLFPIPLGETCAFDRALWERSAREAAIEAAADGLALTFAPMLDVARDPRWGRIAESPGEDPWLASQYAVAKIRGIQGVQLASADSLAACAKHYCAYGAVTAGRDYASVDLSDRTLEEVHLPAFRAAVQAGVATVMPAFTDIGGIPMTIHRPLLRQRLRTDFGFDGVIISDYNAIAELLKHGVAADLAEAAALSLKAGVDIDMMANAYRHGLPVALERGLVEMDDIDQCVRRVLALKERLGLFDDPYRRGGPEQPQVISTRRQFAREAAASSIVMLQNIRKALPLRSDLTTLCVAGPLGDAAAEMGGCWGAAQDMSQHVSVLQGLRAALPEVLVTHAPGVAISGDDQTQLEDAVSVCEGADVVILCVGEAANMSGEAACRTDLDLPGQQRALAQAVFETASNHDIPVIVVLFCGRPLTLPWLFERADAVLVAWFLGSEAGNAVADIVTGRVSPSARTAVSWPRSTGQVPVFFAQRPSGRPASASDHFTSKYLDSPNDPLFPFGHGLTYGQLAYADLRVTPEQASERETFSIAVSVTNSGERAAQETVFLFVRDPVASVSRPVLELKGFTRVLIQPGETVSVQLTLQATELRFPDADLKSIFETGAIEILVGPSAERARLLVACVTLTT